MAEKESEVVENNEISEGETYFSYYLKQRTMWISILLSMFLLLDIITIFVTTTYSFTEIFLYFGIIMLIIAGGSLAFIYLEENYFWAFLGSLVLGLMPVIEIIVILTKSLSGSDLGLAIFSLVLVLILCILPIVLVYLRIEIRNIDLKSS
ncbi:MAG: hypothetical protein FK732_05205 [Asgard group archaeon]|nr:hypothetical protein [Asgard group archaeon]